MEKEKKYRIYKIIMIVAIVAFITFMVTSISLYTYFTKNPITVTSGAKTTNKDISKKLERKRYVYNHKNVIFEIDKYTVPTMNVVAIEGKKEEVDKVYNELKVVIDNNIIND